MLFKTGDRFKVVNNHPNNASLEGKLGTVVRVKPKNGQGNQYEILFDNGSRHPEWSDDGDMEFVGKYPLKIGTVVKYKPNGSEWEITSIDSVFNFHGKNLSDGEQGQDNKLDRYDIIKNGVDNPIRPENMLQKASAMFKRLTDAGTQTLYKAGYINGDLELTSDGTKALLGILYVANKDTLVADAQAFIDEEEKDSKKS